MWQPIFSWTNRNQRWKSKTANTNCMIHAKCFTYSVFRSFNNVHTSLQCIPPKCNVSWNQQVFVVHCHFVTSHCNLFEMNKVKNNPVTQIMFASQALSSVLYAEIKASMRERDIHFLWGEFSWVWSHFFSSLAPDASISGSLNDLPSFQWHIQFMENIKWET